MQTIIEIKPGDRIGNYVLIEKIGAGAFAQVWKARHHERGQRIFAIKIPTDPAFRKQLQREGKLPDIHHESVVSILDSDTRGADVPYIVMPYYAGGTLADLIAKHPSGLPEERVEALLKDILTGLAELHQRGIVHRDIKPSNVLLNEHGQAAIADFGLWSGAAGEDFARSMQQSLSMASSDGRHIAGTLAYMDPEVRDGNPATPASDVYSVGVMLFEMVVGRRPVGPAIPSQWSSGLRWTNQWDRLYQSACARVEGRADPQNLLVALKATPAETPFTRPVSSRESVSNDPLLEEFFHDGNALFEHGTAFLHGTGVRKDPERAIRLYLRSAELGNAFSMSILGLCRQLGHGVPKDKARAVGWFCKAADAGHVRGMRQLAECYASGDGVTKDAARAVAWYRKAAEGGDLMAMLGLALCFGKGEGTPKDSAEAFNWIRRAADLGDPGAMHLVGECYASGDGVTKDDAEAVGWYRKAAEAGHVNAMVNLGVRYANGEGVRKDNAEAFAWYRKAAELGEPNAMFNLGECYDNGDGVSKDDTQAVDWYRKAAEAGDVDAMLILGNRYANGEGVPKDDILAGTWNDRAGVLGRATDLGDARALFDLGNRYATGEGVPKDETLATALYHKASDLGDMRAVVHLAKARRQMKTS